MTTKTLPCVLTDPELTLKGDELATKVSDLDDLRIQKSKYLNNCNERIKRVEKQILELAHVIVHKREDRDVEVVDMPNWQDGIMETIRKDTGEQIARRPLTQDEKQMRLKVVPIDREAAANDLSTVP